MTALEVIAKLEAVARAATPGRWVPRMWRGGLEWAEGERLSLLGHGPIHGEEELKLAIADMEHIAQFHPAQSLRLLSALRIAVEGLDEVIALEDWRADKAVSIAKRAKVRIREALNDGV